MPLPACQPSGKIIAQTLFLGASVASVNVNKGWSGQSSQLTVNLIEDESGCGILKNSQFPTDPNPVLYTHNFGFEDNHYHTCSGVACYDINTENDEYVTKGKVYYSFIDGSRGDPTGGFKSGYWKGADPGFFGVKNRISPQAEYKADTLCEAYDIIGTPVYFKMGALTFGGIIQSWQKTMNSGGKGYTVIINGMESILNECYIILDNFAGSVYAKLKNRDPSNIWAGPLNYIGTEADYFGPISDGNIPNVFNIYGFLESFGKGSFGSSNRNDNGIRVNDIIKGLSVLTSCNNKYEPGSSYNTLQSVGNKNAFSPFGRIITKCMQTQNTYDPISTTFKHMGVIPPVINKINEANGNHCEFVLDLSELPTYPDDYRLSESAMTVMDFINIITEEAGCDFHITLNPKFDVSTSSWINVIKLHTISRLQQPRPNEISNTVNNMLCQGYYISNLTMGKEKNETHAKKILIGGKQQRLYQAKSLRLAYSQSSFILNPVNFAFVDYMTLSKGINQKSKRKEPGKIFYHHGKIKVPSFFSTRNHPVATGINPEYTLYYDYEKVTATPPDDEIWTDKNELESGSITNIPLVNSEAANIITIYNKTSNDRSSEQDSIVDRRFFPLYLDVICPFFGYVSDNEYTIEINAENNEFRRIRPVYYDTWTGQIVVILKTHELPITNLNLQGFYADRGINSFIVTENEIRAAIAGFDNFLVYILAKTYKNDLIEMLRKAYYIKYYNQYIANGFEPIKAKEKANRKTDWYWRLLGGNIAGPYNQPIDIVPDKGDGQANIEQEVMQDLKILHGFVSKLGEFYGKKYMVSAPYVRSYKDEQYLDINLTHGGNDILVFQGGGKLYYNYEPTNDGAWEEYGNYIDNCIFVGGDEWYNLTDDSGKIKPILGYNANNILDYHRYNICKMSQANLDSYLNNGQNNPFWNFDEYDYIKSLRDNTCDTNKFLFEGLNLSSMNATDYIMVEVSGTITKNAFNLPISSSGMKKLYINTSIQEGFSFLDPVRLIGPKIIVDSPGITLNSVSDDVAKDPNRTVIANVAVEDLSLYLKLGGSDPNFINFMSYYISDIHGDDTAENLGEMFGSYAASANQAANFVQIAPKAAHPFFIGIPIKSNQFTYGPWTNYPSKYKGTIFPSGLDVSLISDVNPPVCVTNGVSINIAQAQNAINNMIGSAQVEIDEDLVPWNYGGMGFLDKIAFDKCEKNLNYQSVLETAQLDMPGMPIFDLGMSFTSGNLISPSTTLNMTGMLYTDIKDVGLPITFSNLPQITDNIPTGLLSQITTSSGLLTYQIYNISGLKNYFTSGPIITNIQLSIGQQGLTTTYIFRTYTPKVGLFNKVLQDKVKKNFIDGFRRNKTLAKISQQSRNITETQSRFLIEQKMTEIKLDGETFRSQLFGWSPSTVLIGQASPYLSSIDTIPPYIEPTGLYSQPTGFGNPVTNYTYTIPESHDIGISGVFGSGNLQNREKSIIHLSNQVRHRTSVGLYQTKEIQAQLKKSYGLQSVMSLDGIFSPISFYPTLKNSTFHLGLYNTALCPFCKKSKTIITNFTKYGATSSESKREKDISIFCTKCGRFNDNFIDTLSSTATTTAGTQSIETLPPYIISSGTDISILSNFKLSATTSANISSTANNSSAGGAGVSIPINMATLNPIVVPYGNLSNTNVQNYTGEHPENAHSGINNIGGYLGTSPRTFIDRCHHSIEIIGRGAVRPKILDIHENMKEANISNKNSDFYHQDLLLSNELNGGIYANNQRFFGLKGPIVMHGWGYDLEGYPVPNAADEPYEVDDYNQPRRFKLKLKDGYPKTIKFKNLSYNDIFKKTPSENNEYVKKNNYIFDMYGNKIKASDFLTADTDVTVYVYEDDLKNCGGHYTGAGLNNDIVFDRTIGYQGSIISKTQKWTPTGSTIISNPSEQQPSGQWSEKKKLKEFYLNWAERPDLWPVGPIDLRWDAARRVWTIKSSDAATIYKMVYVTLEEDLVKDDDVDETYPARGFLDDLEYSTEPLGSGLRRLVFIKDRAGYTAPRGAKLLCRYDKDTGFYEPVSKSSFIAKGVISPGTNNASIEMSYAPGKKKGEPYSTMMVNFDNPFDLPTTENKGLFTFLNSKWILTTSK